MKKLILMMLAVFIFMPAVTLAACTNLSSTGGPTITLQNYLYSIGYLTATPNGIYGPATTAAVKKFQTANGITATGTVGPITRLAIQIKSCSTAIVTPTSTTNVPVTVPNPNVKPIITLSPLSNENLTIGSIATLEWSGPVGTTYSIILEDASSTSQGFIISRVFGNYFDWTVGEINTNNTNIVVPPGTYRVHVEDASQGPQSSDRSSAVFTISAKPIYVSAVMPQSGKADDKTAVAVYGSGFGQSTSIDFYGYGRISPTFISGDGKILVFIVPSRTYSGSHTFTVLNTYQSSDVVSKSSEMQFTVVQ